MKDFRDYYESLGVAQNATADELKTAYRRAARRYHPDLNPGDEMAEEKFKEIGEAYEILSDSDRRNEYDQFSQFLEHQKNPAKGLFNRPPKGTKDYSQFKDFSMFVDYLLNRRGESKSPSPSPSPSPSAPTKPKAEGDQKSEVRSQKLEARSQKLEVRSQKSEVRSQKSEVRSQKLEVRSQKSDGEKKVEGRRQKAEGAGEARAAGDARAAGGQKAQNPKSKIQNPPSPSPSQEGDRRNLKSRKPTPNPSQGGKRTIQTPKSKIQNPLEAQLTLPLNKAYKGGKERIRLADGRSLTVTLPPAMLSGQTVQVTAEEPSGNPPSEVALRHHLSLLIQVAPHDLFTLNLPDVHCTIPITPSEAILGGPISIPTLDGSVKMVVPAGARSGQKLRLPGKGYPFNGQRGDQIVELEIQMPTTVTPRERELYEKIRLTESFRPRKNLYF